MSTKYYGCYIITPKSNKDHHYIGYTVNPVRRIKQHNGKKKGAKRTKARGEWRYVALVYGFPNSRLALKFEWNWQNPTKSATLRSVYGTYSSKGFGMVNRIPYKINLMFDLLAIPPWNRLPLNVVFFSDKERKEYTNGTQPLPDQMTITTWDFDEFCEFYKREYGKNKEIELSQEIGEENHDDDDTTGKRMCCLCDKPIHSDHYLVCNVCQSTYHVMCLNRHFLAKSPGRLIPRSGNCVVCDTKMLWGKSIKSMKKRARDKISPARRRRVLRLEETAKKKEKIPTDAQEQLQGREKMKSLGTEIDDVWKSFQTLDLF